MKIFNCNPHTKDTGESKLSYLSCKVSGTLRDIHSSQAREQLQSFKTEILIIPEATRSPCNPRLDRHGSTGKKSESQPKHLGRLEGELWPDALLRSAGNPEATRRKNKAFKNPVLTIQDEQSTDASPKP